VASQEYEAKEVILATSLGRAKQLVLEAFGQTSWNKQLLDLPTMPAVGLQIELDAPATAVDRPTFVPGTCIAAIAEQSRTTFRKSKPGFPRWNGRSGPKAAATLAKPRIPSFTRRVRQDSAT
jgi:hypothetical protein